MNHRNSVNEQKKQKGYVGSELIAPSNYPIAYFNMPKAACTTIKNLLYYIEKGEWFKSPLAIHKEIQLRSPILRKNFFLEHRQKKPFSRPFVTFTFVRNPGLRVYSAFVEKIWANGPYAFPHIREILKTTQQYELNFLESNNYNLDEARKGFKQFLNFVQLNLNGSTKLAPNPHWICQHKRLQKLLPRDQLGFIGRVETFEEDMSFILRKSGWEDLSIASKRFNEGPKSPYKFSDIVDDEIVSIFKALYDRDYLAFDYEVVPS